MSREEILEDKLRVIAEDELMYNALLIYLTKRIEKMLPDIGNEQNNIVGEKYRAYKLSEEIIKNAFEELLSYKKSKNYKPQFSKGK